jgi:hypothetical protein
MDSVPDPSDTNCLICISPCKELSTDLFLYNCQCVYVIHKECFTEWRHISRTNRICIICHEELLPIRGHRVGVLIPIQENRPCLCVRYVVVPFIGVCAVVIIAILIQIILTVQVSTPFYKKNIYLLPSGRIEL